MVDEIQLDKIATLAECIEAVDMRKVNQLRKAIRRGDLIPPIQLRPINEQGFYALHDGNHRILAYYLEKRRVIPGVIDKKLKPISLSWRWPRIGPAKMTFDLISLID